MPGAGYIRGCTCSEPESLEIEIRVFGPDSIKVSASYNNIGVVYQKQDRSEEKSKVSRLIYKARGQDSFDVAQAS